MRAMPSLPDLSELSHEQKDELIGALMGQVQELTRHLLVLQERVKTLEGRLSMNSRNSSKPPQHRRTVQTRPEVPAQERRAHARRAKGPQRPQPLV